MTEAGRNRVEIFYDEVHGVFVAEMPELLYRAPRSEFPYVSAFGGTRDEALREVQIAERIYYSDEQRRKALGIRG